MAAEQCARCGATLFAGDRFCGECGNPVTAPPPDDGPGLDPALEQTVLRSTVLAHLADDAAQPEPESEPEPPTDPEPEPESEPESPSDPEAAPVYEPVYAPGSEPVPVVVPIVSDAAPGEQPAPAARRSRLPVIIIGAVVALLAVLVGAAVIVTWLMGRGGSTLVIAEGASSGYDLAVVGAGDPLERDDQRARGADLESSGFFVLEEGTTLSLPVDVLLQGDRLTYVERLDSGGLRLMSSVSSEEAVELLDTDASYLFVTSVESEVLGVEAYGDDVECLRIEGTDRPTRVADGDGCGFSGDMERAYGYRLGDEDVSVEVVSFADGETIGEFDASGTRVLPAGNADRFAVVEQRDLDESFTVYDAQGEELGQSGDVDEVVSAVFASGGTAVVTTRRDDETVFWSIDSAGAVDEVAAGLSGSLAAVDASGVALLSVESDVDEYDLLRLSLTGDDPATVIDEGLETVDRIYTDGSNARFVAVLDDDGAATLVPVPFEGESGEAIDLDEGVVDEAAVVDGELFVTQSTADGESLWKVDVEGATATVLMEGDMLGISGTFADGLLVTEYESGGATLYTVPLSGDGKAQDIYDADLLNGRMIALGGDLFVAGGTGDEEADFEVVRVDPGSQEMPETLYDGFIAGTGDPSTLVSADRIRLPSTTGQS